MKTKRMLSMILVFALVCSLFAMNITEASAAVSYPKTPSDARYGVSAAGQNTHDPSIIYDSTTATYYVYCTGITSTDVEIRKSTDLITWTYVGTAGLMPANSAISGYIGGNLWAPDVVKVGNTYRMYYSCSSLGSGDSCIALATSSSPTGPFTYQGIVLRSTTSQWVSGGANAIDANICQTANGSMYMTYGSFFGGIYIIAINSSTGYTTGSATNIAKNPTTSDGAIEAPYIMYNSDTGYYYLFASYGNLNNDYNVRVGRATSITGPYYDYNGRTMTSSASKPYKLTTAYQFSSGRAWFALGHNSVLSRDVDNDGTNEWFLLNHARTNVIYGTEFYLQVRQMMWVNGWPVVNPSFYAGEDTDTIVDATYVPGTYERRVFTEAEDASYSSSSNTSMTLYQDYTANVNGTSGTWSFSGTNTVTVKYGYATETYKFTPAYNYESNRASYALTGINNSNYQIWAKQKTYLGVPNNIVEEEAADFTALQTAITNASNYSISNYTASSYATLRAAVAAGNNIISTNTPTQSIVDTITTAINNAISNLVVKPVISYTSLQTAINNAASYSESDYTAASYNTLKVAVAAGNLVIANNCQTQAIINSITTAINDAINGLVPASSTVSYTALNRAISNAGRRSESAYTASSYAALKAAVSAGNMLINNNCQNQTIVDNITAEINTAMNNLVRV